MVGSSVTDPPAWIDELPTGGPVLIVAEGLLMYLTPPSEVTDLLHRVIDRFDAGEVHADLLSKWGSTDVANLHLGPDQMGGHQRRSGAYPLG